MDQEKVDVVELQLFERVLERPFDCCVAACGVSSYCFAFLDIVLWRTQELGLTLFRLVQVVPHLGADEEIFTLDLAILLLEEIPDGVANLFFVLVEPCTVEVAVSRCMSVFDSLSV